MSPSGELAPDQMNHLFISLENAIPLSALIEYRQQVIFDWLKAYSQSTALSQSVKGPSAGSSI
jgi:hypothetical protein